MMDYKTRELLDAAYTRVRWIGNAFIASLFIEAAFVEGTRWLLPSSNGVINAENGIPSTLQYVLVAFGLLDLIFLPFIRRMMLATQSSSQPDSSALISRLRSVSIAVIAVSFAPSIMGLVSFLVTGERLGFYILWGAALVSLLFNFPRLNFWEDWAEEGGQLDV